MHAVCAARARWLMSLWKAMLPLKTLTGDWKGRPIRRTTCAMFAGSPWIRRSKPFSIIKVEVTWPRSGRASRWAVQSETSYPLTPKSDQAHFSPAASPAIWNHTVWRTWLFIAYSVKDDYTTNSHYLITNPGVLNRWIDNRNCNRSIDKMSRCAIISYMRWHNKREVKSIDIDWHRLIDDQSIITREVIDYRLSMKLVGKNHNQPIICHKKLCHWLVIDFQHQWIIDIDYYRLLLIIDFIHLTYWAPTTTYQPHTNHTLTTYQQHTNHILTMVTIAIFQFAAQVSIRRKIEK